MVRIIDNEIYVYKTKLYHTTDDNRAIDYTHDKVLFFTQQPGSGSLNQSVDGVLSDDQTIEIKLNTAFEVLKAFKEVDQENEKRVERLFA